MSGRGGFSSGGPGGGGGGGIPAALSQGTWFIDPLNGNNNNNGLTALTAIKTFAEMERRLGHYNTITPPLVAGIPTMTVTLLNDAPSSDPRNLMVAAPANTQIIYKGTPTITRSGTLSAAGQINRATNTAATVTDAGVASWAADVNSRILLTSGANTGATSWVAKDLGGHQARTASFNINPTAADNVVTPAPAAATNTYSIQHLTQYTEGYVSIVPARSASLAEMSLVQFDLDQQPTTFGTFSYFVGGARCWFIGCRIGETIEPTDGQYFFENCCFPGGAGVGTLPGCAEVDVDAGFVNGVGAGSSSVVSNAAVLSLDFDLLIQNNPVQVVGTGLIVFGAVGIFDGPGNGLELGPLITLGGPGGQANVSNALNSGIDALYGQGNALVGVAVGGGCNVTYVSGDVPTLTGAGGDFTLGGATSANSFTSPSYNGAISCTWAHLAAAIGGPGFGGNAHNLVANAHIMAAA